MRRPSLFLFAALLGAVAFGGAACRRDEIRTYAVAKEPAAPADSANNTPPPAGAPAAPGAAMSANMADIPVDTATGPGLAWDTPASWNTGPERPMRKATLLIPGENGAPGAELAVTAFPGDVGGNLANVNRWRQQLSLPPIAETELGKALQHLHVGALHIDIVELVGPSVPSQRVIGAIVPYSGSTWFFKLTGPDTVVSQERDNFLALIRSLRPAN